MKIVTDLVDFEILIPSKSLERQVQIIEKAGRTCYKSYEGTLITQESARKFIKMILSREHESVIEHSLITVRIKTSIGETREQERHRIASYSEQSTRYVKINDLVFVFPPHRDIGSNVSMPDGRKVSVKEAVQFFEDFYSGLLVQLKWPPEDARQFLPLGTQSELVISANFREWRHIMAMRTSKAAHWEIRTVMCALLIKFQSLIPVVFSDFVFKGKDKNGVPYFVKKRQISRILEDLENAADDMTPDQLKGLKKFVKERGK
jgi:thymidylate synthase (FAD)